MRDADADGEGDGEPEYVADPADDGSDDEMLQPWPPNEWHGPLESITMRPRLFIFPIILLVTLALIAGFVRKPVYTASAQLIVGSVVRDFQLNDGQAAAINDLTDIYSRLVGGSDFMAKVDDTAGEPVPVQAFTAAPIPDSSLIRLDAEGSDQQQAIDRADTGADALAAYVKDLQADSVESSQAKLREVEDAQKRLTAAQAQAAQLRAAAGGADTAPVQEADAAAATIQVEVNTLQDNYRLLQQTSGGIGLEKFGSAQPLGSDRKSTLQIYGIAGLLIGALLGMALATLSANRWKLLPTPEEPRATT